MKTKYRSSSLLVRIGEWVMANGNAVLDLLNLIGQLVISTGYYLRHPREIDGRFLLMKCRHYGLRFAAPALISSALLGIILTLIAQSQLAILNRADYLPTVIEFLTSRLVAPSLSALLLLLSVISEISRIMANKQAMPTYGHALLQSGAIVLLAPIYFIWIYTITLLSSIATSELFGFSYLAYINSLQKITPLSDFFIGIMKNTIFGVIIACTHLYYIYHPRANIGQTIIKILLMALMWVFLANVVFVIVGDALGFS